MVQEQIMYTEFYGFENEELTMRVQYPQLFSSGNFEDKIYFNGGGEREREL